MIYCTHQAEVQLVDAVLRAVRVGMLWPAIRSGRAEMKHWDGALDCGRQRPLVAIRVGVRLVSIVPAGDVAAAGSSDNRLHTHPRLNTIRIVDVYPLPNTLT